MQRCIFLTAFFLTWTCVVNCQKVPSLKPALAFIENKGQLTDQYGQPRSDINFVLQTREVAVMIGNGTLHYMLLRQEGSDGMDSIRNLQVQVRPKEKSANGFSGLRTPSIQGYRLDVTLLHANRHAVIIKEGARTEQYHYYNKGKEQRAISNVPAYEKIIYKDIYPHIDWVLYATGNELKYDFVVHPGGKVSDIKWKYEGAEDILINRQGGIEISTPLGTITEQKPYSYELATQKEIKSTFTLNEGVAGFNTARHQGTLVIDPGVSWATYFGGAGSEVVADIASDKNGNIYVTGNTSSLANIVTTGAYQTDFIGGSVLIGAATDAYLAKFSSTGQLIWATYYGGYNSIISFLGGGDLPNAVTCDDFGHVYVVGATSSEDGIATPGSFQEIFSSNTVALSLLPLNGFLIQFNEAGLRQWGTYYGASTLETMLSAVVCDRDGYVYAAGYVTGPDGNENVTTPGAYQPAFAGGNNDGILIKFDSLGNRVWGTYFGGESPDVINTLCNDTSGNLYIAGNTNSQTGIGTSGSFLPDQNPNEVANPGFAAKFSKEGQRQWGTYINGMCYSMAASQLGHVFISGVSESSYDSLITTSGSYMQQAYAQENDFLMQLEAQTGQRNWGTYYSGEEGSINFSNKVACDADNNVYLAGSTNSKGFVTQGSIYRLATPRSHQDTLNAPPGPASWETPPDFYLAKFDPFGNRKWATYYGGTGSDGYRGALYSTVGLAVGIEGAVYMAGVTNSTDIFITEDAHQQSLGGETDAFLIKFLPVDIAISEVQSPLSEDTLCAGIMPLAVEIRNQGKMDKTDVLMITYMYSGPASGTATADFVDGLAMETATFYDLEALTLMVPGLYTITVYIHYTKDDEELNNDTLQFSTYIKAPPVVSINAYKLGDLLYFSNDYNVQPGDSYHWDFGDGTTSGAILPTHTYGDVNASYIVTLTVINECGMGTDTIQIQGNGTGISGKGGNELLLVYPNPAGKELYIKVKGLTPKSYEVVDALGRRVLEGKLNGNNDRIDVRNLNSGAYYIRVQTDKGMAEKAFQVVW